METAINKIFPLQLLSNEELPQDTIEEVIVRRGSTREFSRDSITFAQLSTMLDRATRGIDADCFPSVESSLNDLYLIVHAVEGLPSGAYVFRRQERALELLKEGDFRREAGYLGLGQEIPADCSVNVYFLADLENIFKRFGNRGYRVAQLEAAIMGGKLYLAAYAQRLGASGLTFFDDDVTEFFSPHAAGKSVMFLIALGKSAKRKSVIRKDHESCPRARCATSRHTDFIHRADAAVAAHRSPCESAATFTDRQSVRFRIRVFIPALNCCIK